MRMSGHRCFYYGCDSRKGIEQKVNDISFYRFPKKKETFIAWVNACQNPKIYKRSVKNVALYGMVCSKHFGYLDFSNPLVKKKVLKTDALPFPNKVNKYIVHDIMDESFILENAKPTIKNVWKSEHEKKPTAFKKNEIYAENVFSSPPHSPSGGNQKQKDLVSPRRLMNILESSCPLIRPISPTPSENDDSHDVGFPPLIPEVTMITPFSPYNDSENGEDEENSLLSSFGEGENTTTLTLTISTSTITVTTTSANGTSTATTTATATTPSARGMSAKWFSEAYKPRPSAKKRPLEESQENKNDSDPDWPETPSRRRKCKRVFASRGRRKDNSREMVLDLSGLSIQKLEKTSKGTPAARTTELYLDNNFLEALPTLNSYKKLTKVSLVNNMIDSLVWFGELCSLRVLNLSRNKLTSVDGLWKLWHLTDVNLSGNEIQEVSTSHLKGTLDMESLNLSDNKISHIEDLSLLTNLKELLLHRNCIKTLSQWKTFLPTSLLKLTLAENSIVNLSDVAELSLLERLEEFSLQQNHCINVLQLVDSRNIPIGPPRSFNYRPYVLTWCPTLIKLDNREITEDERSKAHWLLSNEKFWEVSEAKHVTLVKYLSSACPLSVQAQRNETSSIQPGEPHKLPAQPNDSTDAKPLVLSSSGSFPVKKITVPLNNNNLEKMPLSSLSKNVSLPQFDNTAGCSPGVPCQHYVELIEEKARNHKLQRKTEVLQARIDDLMQRVRLLETAMVQNGVSLDDMCIKIEVEDEPME